MQVERHILDDVFMECNQYSLPVGWNLIDCTVLKYRFHNTYRSVWNDKCTYIYGRYKPLQLELKQNPICRKSKFDVFWLICFNALSIFKTNKVLETI